MREKSKAIEDKLAQLMESYTASKTIWDKEVEEKLQCERGQYDELFNITTIFQKSVK